MGGESGGWDDRVAPVLAESENQPDKHLRQTMASPQEAHHNLAQTMLFSNTILRNTISGSQSRMSSMTDTGLIPGGD